MRLSRRDLSATVLMAALIGIYAAYLQDTGGFIISSTRATTAVVAVLGAAAWANGRAGELYRMDRFQAMAWLGLSMSLLGVAALIAAVVGIVAGSASALDVLVGATVASWLIATLRHAFSPAKPQDRFPDIDARDGGPDGGFEVPVGTDFPPEDTEREPRRHEVIEPEVHRHDLTTR